MYETIMTSSTVTVRTNKLDLRGINLFRVLVKKVNLKLLIEKKFDESSSHEESFSHEESSDFSSDNDLYCSATNVDDNHGYSHRSEEVAKKSESKLRKSSTIDCQRSSVTSGRGSSSRSNSSDSEFGCGNCGNNKSCSSNCCEKKTRNKLYSRYSTSSPSYKRSKSAAAVGSSPPKSILRPAVTYTYVRGMSGIPTIRVPLRHA